MKSLLSVIDLSEGHFEWGVGHKCHKCDAWIYLRSFDFFHLNLNEFFYRQLIIEIYWNNAFTLRFLEEIIWVRFRFFIGHGLEFETFLSKIFSILQSLVMVALLLWQLSFGWKKLKYVETRVYIVGYSQ